MKKALLTLLLCLTSLPSEAASPRILKVGFTPWENQQDMARSSQAIVEAMSRSLKIRVVPFVATDYSGVIEAMRSKKLDVAFLPPAAYVMARKQAGAKVILKSKFGKNALYYAAIITHKDSKIKNLKGLKGRTFAFVDPASTSGCIYPKVMLMNAGLNPDRDFSRLIFAGGHDATVLAVLNRQVDAGATYANNKGTDNAWYKLLKPADRAKIRVLAYSRPIPSDNISVRGDLDPALEAKIKHFFLAFGETPKGRKTIKDIYNVDGFDPASDQDYYPVREAFEKVGLKFK
ncbi:MAG: phosphate/phosphite/phosphonate ABC transporter substrate-binding protein [Bacteroidota bacterium]